MEFKITASEKKMILKRRKVKQVTSQSFGLLSDKFKKAFKSYKIFEKDLDVILKLVATMKKRGIEPEMGPEIRFRIQDIKQAFEELDILYEEELA